MRQEMVGRPLRALVLAAVGGVLAAAPARADLYQAPQFLPNGVSVGDIETGDVNGDGQPDIVTIGVNSPPPPGPPQGPPPPQLLNVFLNNGKGSFIQSTPFGLPHAAHSLSVGDLDGDGRADMLVSGFRQATILWSDVQGAFAAQWPIPFTSQAGYVEFSAIADMNGDGRPDIVLSDRDRDEIVVLLVHEGSGVRAVLDPPRHSPAGESPRDLRVADMNGDGHADVVLTNPHPTGGPSTVRILYGDGTGFLPEEASFLLEGAQRPNTLALGDLTGDGRPDVVTANGQPNTLTVLRNTGIGLTRAFDAGFVARADSVRLADVNGDGRLDAVAGTYDDDTVAVLLGNGDGTLGAARTYPAATVHNGSVAVADLTGDGQVDIVSGGSHPSIAVLIHEDALQVEAGPDVVTAGNGAAIVTLTATVNSPHQGVTFRWREGRTVLGTGSSLTTSFGIGSHLVVLEAASLDGAFASDSVRVAVVPPFASQASVEALHAKVDGLGDPAQQATVKLVGEEVGRVGRDVAAQGMLVEALMTFVSAKLDVTAGSRASSLELAAAVDELKAAGLTAASLEALGASVREALGLARREQLRVSIETALARGDRVTFFMLPESRGGLLELVRSTVFDAILKYPPSDRAVQQANVQLARGDAALRDGEHTTAYRRFVDAYRALTN